MKTPENGFARPETARGKQTTSFAFPELPAFFDLGHIYGIVHDYAQHLADNGASARDAVAQAGKEIFRRYDYAITGRLDQNERMFLEGAKHLVQSIKTPDAHETHEVEDLDAVLRQQDMDAELELLNREDY